MKVQISIILSACLLAAGICRGAAADVPPASLKIPPMVIEHSLSTFIPSLAADAQGLAVNIIYPEKPRYSSGAPPVVVVPGGMASDGLGLSLHAAQSGFAEVRFAFPGGGIAGFSSGGAYDYRGAQSALALKDIVCFAAGKTKDYRGRTIAELLPVKVACENLGLVGWSNGGNLLIVTLAKFASALSFVKWLSFYESPVGSLFYPPCLGSASDFILNRHYRQGSCATGNCLIDLRRLSWLPDGQKSPGAHKKIGEPEIKGVFFFDDNKNRQWDETTEFALPYAAYPGFEKQFYPPVILKAAKRLNLFLTTRIIKPKKKDNDDDQDLKGSRKDNKAPEEKHAQGKGFLAPTKEQKKKENEPPKFEIVTVWPHTLATLAESESYFQDRDGSLYLSDVCKQFPRLLVGVFGSAVDHLQAQSDHPHIAFLYNYFLSNKIWVRLNPDPLYAGQVAAMNGLNFTDNKANTSIDASAIESYLEPEGLIPDYAFIDASIAELSDRVKYGKLDATLTAPLTNYVNGAARRQENR